MTCRFVLRFATSHTTEEQACRYAEMRIKWSNFVYYLHWIVLLKAEAEGFPTLWPRWPPAPAAAEAVTARVAAEAAARDHGGRPSVNLPVHMLYVFRTHITQI